MSLSNITEWLKQCPQMANLFSISAEGNDGDNLITPFSSSDRASISEQKDITGFYEADIVPFVSVYEEYQIDCFRMAYSNEDNYNIMSYEDVKSVCDWIEAQNLTGNFPEIGEQIVRVEPKPFLPSVRFRDVDANLVGYYFTLRITYVNKMQRRGVEYESG